MMADLMIEDHPIERHPGGVDVYVRMPWYRGLPLSSVTRIGLTIDGVVVPEADMRFVVDDVEYALDELPARHDRWWYVLDSAVLRIRGIELPPGTHRVDLRLGLLIPYLAHDGIPALILERASKDLDLEGAAA